MAVTLSLALQALGIVDGQEDEPFAHAALAAAEALVNEVAPRAPAAIRDMATIRVWVMLYDTLGAPHEGRLAYGAILKLSGAGSILSRWVVPGSLSTRSLNTEALVTPDPTRDPDPAPDLTVYALWTADADFPGAAAWETRSPASAVAHDHEIGVPSTPASAVNDEGLTYLRFAVPHALSDIRETGSSFPSSGLFGTPRPMEIDGATYQVYSTRFGIYPRAALTNWTLTPA